MKITRESVLKIHCSDLFQSEHFADWVKNARGVATWHEKDDELGELAYQSVRANALQPMLIWLSSASVKF